MVTRLSDPAADLPLADESGEDPDAVAMRDAAATLNREGDTSDIQRQIDELDFAEATEPSAEAPSAEAPSAEAASPTVPVPPSPSQAPDEMALLRRQLADFQTREAQYAAREQEQRIAQATEAVTRDFVAQGWDEAQARLFATEQRNAYLREQQVEQRYKTQIAAERQRFQDAIDVGGTHGADPRELMGYSDRQSMERAAKQAKEIRDLKTTVAKLQQGRVPAQRLETGVPGNSGTFSDRRALERLQNKPFEDMSEKELATFKRLIGET